MVAIAHRSLKGVVTWWTTSPNGSGGDSFGAPTLIKGRWEERQEVYIGQVDRRELVSKAVVYLDRSVAVGDYLANGDQSATTDPTTIEADKVQRYQKFPDLRNLEVQHKAIL